MGIEHALHAQRNHSRKADRNKGERQRPTEKAGNTGTVISGFQKTRSCVMTWGNLRGQPEEVMDPTSPAPECHSNTTNSVGKKRTKTTLPGLAPAHKKRQKTTREKTGRMSLQLLEGAVNPEHTEFASQEGSNFEPYSPPGTP